MNGSGLSKIRNVTLFFAIIVIVSAIASRTGYVSFGSGDSAKVVVVAEVPSVEAPASSEVDQQVKAVTEVVVGDVARVPQWQWVDPVNNDHCGMEFGAEVVVEQVKATGVLVSYSPPDSDTGGTPCDDGDRFTLSVSQFVGMTSRYERLRDDIEKTKRAVRKVLAKEFYGEELDPGEWRWVDLVNPKPVYGRGYPLEYGDSCGVEGKSVAEVGEGGMIRVRGKIGAKTLYEFTADDNGPGSPCPSGVLFLH